MKYTNLLKNALAFFLCALFGPMRAQPADTLLLQAVIERTIANNPNVQSSSLSVLREEGNFRASKGKFNAQYSAFVTKSFTETPNSIIYRDGLFGEPVDFSSESRRFRYGVDASKLLPTGTVLSAGLDLTNFGRDELYKQLLMANMGTLITNRSGVYVGLSQPLKRGFGSTYQMANVKIAEYGLSAQRQQYVYSASVEVLESILAYIDYVAAQRNLEIQSQNEVSYSRAVQDLQKLVEKDLIPAADLLFIRSNTASQANGRIYAENNLAYNRNLLGFQMGLDKMEIPRIPLPTYHFPIESLQMPDSSYLNQWLDEALAQRPDYQALLQYMEANRVDVEFSKRQVQPRLDLNASIGYSGVYEGRGVGQFFAPFGQNIPGLNYSVGISMDIAPRFDAEKGQLVASMATLDQSQQEVYALRNSIYLNIRRYYDQLRYFSNVVEYSKQAVSFNETALRNEYTKLKLGTSTVINVVQIQNNYVISLSSLNRAYQDLNTAFFLFKFHTGTLLQAGEAGGVSVDYGALLQLPK